MDRCLQLAKMGQGYVSPNPMVGCVVVYDDKIIGEGYHQQYGEAHAEVNAINAVKDKSLLKLATLYVNLEPCAHFGKTPPCANLIIDSEIPNVVIGCIDSYSEVAGKGIEKMEAAGIEVKAGIREQASLALNRRFFTFHTHKRPYVVLKWAASADGFTDIDRSATNKKGVFWITGAATKTLVHKWRHEEAGILVGRNTVANDNPSLTCRDFKGISPTRFVIDQKMKLDYGAFTVGDRTVPTFIFTEKAVKSTGNLQFITPADFSTTGILSALHALNIQSVIIEGGSTTINHFIAENNWDEARILTGNGTIGNGQKAPVINGKIAETGTIGSDTLKIIYNG